MITQSDHYGFPVQESQTVYTVTRGGKSVQVQAEYPVDALRQAVQSPDLFSFPMLIQIVDMDVAHDDMTMIFSLSNGEEITVKSGVVSNYPL